MAAPGDVAAKTLHREMHRVTGKVTDDVERFQFNTAIAAMMELTNAAYDYRKAVRRGRATLRCSRRSPRGSTLLLAPFTPHMCEELWREVLALPGLRTPPSGRRSTPRQPRPTRSSLRSR